jgi:hypothetical protein
MTPEEVAEATGRHMLKEDGDKPPVVIDQPWFAETGAGAPVPPEKS